jgi:prepilin-type processing-associated H-X9-DG protein
LALQGNETVGSLESADTTTQVTLNANTLTVGGDGTNRSFAGAISGEGGGLTKIGSGIQTLSGVNTYTGHTQINNGVISVAGGSAIPDAVRVSLTNDGTLNLQANETVGSLDSAATTTRVTLNANTLTVGGDNTNQSFAGVISGTGGLTKTGSGTQMLTGANTYEGTTTVSAGVLGIENSEALGTTAGGTTVASGASLQFSGGITVTGESLTLTGEGAGSSGALRNLSHNNEWAGPITVQAGQTGRIGVDSGSLTLSGPITFSGTQMGGFLVVHGAGVLNITGDISGGTAGGESVATSGNLSGTLNLSGANTYAGHTRINAGTISVAGGSAIPDASRVWLFGTGKLALQANETIGSLDSDAAGSQVVLNANTLTVGGDDTNRSFAGSISGAGGVTKIGAGVQTLKGSGIAYQGNTAVSGGRLVFEDATSFGNNQPGPTTMAVSNSSTLEFKVGAGKQQNVGLAGQVTISGNGSLVKSGDGTLALGGQHSYSGDTILEGGTLTLQGGVRANASSSMAEIRDGTSNTILLAEIRAGVVEHDIRGVWALSGAGPSSVWAHGFIGDANGPNPAGLLIDDTDGCSEVVATVGSPEALASMDMGCCCNYGTSRVNWQAAVRSTHPGGVMTCFADGSVHFISNSIETNNSINRLSAWDKLNLSMSGEVVTSQSY